MNLFKKNDNSVDRSEKLLLEIVKDTNDLYEDFKSEYEAIEDVVSEFVEFIEEIRDRLNEEEKAKSDNLAHNLSKVNNYATRSIRDIRDLLRQQKKVLNEIKHDH